MEISLIQSCRSRGFAIEPPFTNQEIREGSAKALLDTNVWRYVADCGFAAQLLKTQKEKRKEVRVTVAPTTVFEIAKIGDQDLRKKLLNLVAHQAWQRLPNDQFIECEQLHKAVTKYQPAWLLTGPSPDYDRLAWHHKKIKGGWWTKSVIDAKERPESLLFLARNMATGEDSIDKNTQDRANDNLVFTGKAVKQGVKQKKLIPIFREAVRAFEFTGVHGEKNIVRGDYWRLQGLMKYSHWPHNAGGPSDWLYERLDLKRLNLLNKAYVNFWTQTVVGQDLPAHWVSACIEFYGLFRRQSSGTLGDISLARYLSEVDYFITGDKIFADLVNRCREEADFPVAKPVLIQSSKDGAQAVIDFFHNFDR